jgi:pimeloyl-ACP methyl ester carboxylesterase
VAFQEGQVETDGFRIRYMAAGDGPVLVHLHGAGGMRLNPSHDLLSQRFRVIAFEMPGFGEVENQRTQTMQELAATMASACRAIGIDRCGLLGTSFGGKVALWIAAQDPKLVSTLVLEAPAAIRPDGLQPPSGTPEQIAQMVYAHPERMPPVPKRDPQQAAQIGAFVRRVRGPDRDAALEAVMPEIAVPVLVVLGARDALIPSTVGRIYKDLLRDAHLVFVYDCGHAIASERPEAFVEVVADFLERTDAFVISRAKTVILP